MNEKAEGQRASAVFAAHCLFAEKCLRRLIAFNPAPQRRAAGELPGRQSLER